MEESKTLNRGVQRLVERTVSDQSRNVEMPSALIELERRQRWVELQINCQRPSEKSCV